MFGIDFGKWGIEFSKPLLYRVLGCLQLFIGLGGIAGGIGLLADPTGENVGMAIEVLDGTPFESYMIPGIVLFSINGLGSCLGSLLSFKRFQSSGKVAVALGVFLMLWILAQVYWIGLVHWLQPAYFLLGLVEMLLGFSVDSFSKSRKNYF